MQNIDSNLEKQNVLNLPLISEMKKPQERALYKI